MHWLATCTSFWPLPPSGHASQAPVPVAPHPFHSLWHCCHLIFCHLLRYLLFQFCLPLLGSPPHLHHCLHSFCPLFLFMISSWSLAATSPYLLLTLLPHQSLPCPISPSVPLPDSLRCLSPQHHTISFYCFMCCFPVLLSPSPMVPLLCPSLCHPPWTPLCLPLLSLLLTALFSTTCLATVIHCLFWPAPFAVCFLSSSSSSSPRSRVCSLPTLFLFAVPLTACSSPQMTRTILRSASQAITYCPACHPACSCCFILSPPVWSCPVCRQPSQLLFPIRWPCLFTHCMSPFTFITKLPPHLLLPPATLWPLHFPPLFTDSIPCH